MLCQSACTYTQPQHTIHTHSTHTYTIHTYTQNTHLHNVHVHIEHTPTQYTRRHRTHTYTQNTHLHNTHVHILPLHTILYIHTPTHITPTHDALYTHTYTIHTQTYYPYTLTTIIHPSHFPQETGFTVNPSTVLCFTQTQFIGETWPANASHPYPDQHRTLATHTPPNTGCLMLGPGSRYTRRLAEAQVA